MDKGKGLEPATVASSSSNSRPGNGSGQNGNGDQEHRLDVLLFNREIENAELNHRLNVLQLSGNGNEVVNDEQQIVAHQLPHISLTLSLSPPIAIADLNIVPPLPPPPPPAPVRPAAPIAPVAPARAPRRNIRRNPNVPPPYIWATNERARIHSLQFLMSSGIHTISGEVHCKKCRSNFTIQFNLLTKFNEIKRYIIRYRELMRDRAPLRWTNPDLPACSSCHYPHSLRPTLGKKRAINWLFLTLSQMLGLCSIAQLKYFCKHTNNHRTGAKDRLLYLTYLGVCKQLQDIPPFHYSIP